MHVSIQSFQTFAEFMAFIWLMVFMGLVESVYSGPQIRLSQACTDFINLF